jgi:N-acetylglutamate synthase-like GNAT family acetyltransferase
MGLDRPAVKILCLRGGAPRTAERPSPPCTIMFGMDIRAASASDVEQIVALVNFAFRVESFLVYGDRTNPAQISAMFQTGTFLLAETAGELTGCVYLELRGDRGYFGLLSVNPALQRQGLGRGLVGEAENRAKAAGCEFMDIVLVNVRTELIPMYERLGYAESGLEPFPPHVPTKIPCHFLRMSKSLR